MRAARSILYVGPVLVAALWVGRPSMAEDGGLEAARDQSRVCHEKQAALRPEFEATVSEHNSCKTSSDCSVITPGCPFGCYVAVRAIDVALVESRARELVSRNGSECRCMYKCTQKPRSSCVHGRCTIEGKP
jgi:hypothetical protein